MLLFRAIADVVVAVHAAFVGFVVFGMVAIVVGLVLGWHWVCNFWFRVTHLGAIGFVVVQSMTGVECPLTTWERSLRERSGQASYPGGFIAHWLHELIFFEAPEWVFMLAYTSFGLAVLAVFVLRPPRWPRFRLQRRTHHELDAHGSHADDLGCIGRAQPRDRRGATAGALGDRRGER